jgi:hypothetical protein
MNRLFKFQSQVVRPVSESDDYYPSIVLNPRWRVIECRDDLQWILQARNRAETVARGVWRGRSYCRTREALIRCCDRHAGAIDPAAMAVLKTFPERFPLCIVSACSTGAGLEAHHAG